MDALWQTEEMRTYAEDTVTALVARPKTEYQLREVILRARAEGRRITFHAGTQCLDRQALPLRATDVAVSMDAFKDIHIDEPADLPHSAWVTAGAGARWGDIVRALEKRGLVPYVVVTSSHASIGGTVTSDCLSRFTSDHGKESKLVARLRMMIADGSIMELTREIPNVPGTKPSEKVAGFDPILGVIGGFGLLGAVIDVTFLVHRVEDGGANPIAVRSLVRKYHALEPMLEALFERAYKLVKDDGFRNPKGLFAVASYTREASSWLNILITSYYVRPVPGRGKRMPQHQSDSPLRPIGEWLKRVPGFTPLFWRFVYYWFGQRYVDPLYDYTFFMDGNVRTKKIERAFGVHTRVRQQTFLIPAPEKVADQTFDIGPSKKFFLGLRKCLRRRGLEPILLDVLFVPEDDAYLSGSRGMPALAVTVAFEPLGEERAAEAEAALCELASLAAKQGGRVHLTKRVCSDPALVAEAYGPGLEALAALKKALDPDGLFDSAFAERTLRPAAKLRGITL